MRVQANKWEWKLYYTTPGGANKIEYFTANQTLLAKKARSHALELGYTDVRLRKEPINGLAYNA